MAQHVTDQDFQSSVLEASKSKPVLVDFFADWCGPCQMLAPIIDELAGEIADKALVVKLNVDENQTSASQYNVMSIPTLILFKDGQARATVQGLRNKAALLEMIEKHL